MGVIGQAGRGHKALQLMMSGRAGGCCVCWALLCEEGTRGLGAQLRQHGGVVRGF